MMQENYSQIIETALAQEDMLRFYRFSSDDAWALGQFLVQRVIDAGIDMAICIRRMSGYILFQYGSENTTLSNQQWMQRKFNTVVLTEGSSLRAWATSEMKGQSLEEQGLSSRDYALCGGGFPIRLKSGELVGVLTVSNLPHKLDHSFITDALAAYLHVDGVPAL